MEQEQQKTFAPTLLIPGSPPSTNFYSHGFTSEQVENIKSLHAELEKRDKNKIPVTLEEFKTIVVPFCRINRTEQFVLNSGKEKKEKSPKEPKVKEVKVKKPSKKELDTKLKEIIFKKALNQPITEEEELFFLERAK